MIREWLEEYKTQNTEEARQALREIIQEIALAGLQRLKKFIGFTANDTIYYHDDKGIDYLRNLYKSNIVYLDSVIPVLRFKRNKEIFKNLNDYFSNVNSYFNNKPCDTCLIETSATRQLPDSTLITIRRTYIIDSFYLTPLIQFRKNVTNLSDMNDYANSHARISLFLKPSIWIEGLFGAKQEEVNINISF